MAEPEGSPARKRTVNKSNRRNQVVFAITLIVLQVGVSVSYAFVGSVGM